ncbi:MAG TPA: hypothetical protein PKM41_02920 [Deltaproteobacteria bacterium]|jgi:hypothetical protein|nr:hypothetical protein [Deltaproteobacteria bacterium]HOI05805.1 hypothetical protein [Deltaproteobacteria bacterium]
MNPGFRIVVLFVFPIVALMACATITFSLPEPKPYVPERPQFLNAIDGLDVSSGGPGDSISTGHIRNVFVCDGVEAETVPEEPAPAEPAPQAGKPVSRDPVSVTMVVDGPNGGFGVVNGKKMHVGERSGEFTLTAIRNNSITIRYTDGIEETIHVKAY